MTRQRVKRNLSFVRFCFQADGLINLILIPDELDVSEPLEDVLLDSLAEEGSTGD